MVSLIALAPKKLLKKREALSAHNKIVSLTIMPSAATKVATAEPNKLKGQIVVAPTTTSPCDTVGLAMSAA